MSPPAACTERHHVFDGPEGLCRCGSRTTIAGRGFTTVPAAPVHVAAAPTDLLGGEVQAELHWRDALVACAELRNAAEAWRETGEPIAVGAAERMDRASKALEEAGRLGATREREERLVRGVLVQEGLASS